MADDEDMAEDPDEGAPKRGDAGVQSDGSSASGEAPKRSTGLIAALVALVVGTGVLLALTFAKPRTTTSADPNAAIYAAIGGPFHMTNQDGRAVDQGVLNGKVSAVFFGYVTCPDICPATLQTLAAAQAKLGGDAAKFQVVFVSVDPQRDTPKLLKTYLGEPGFPPHAVGLTGTKDQVAAVAKAYRVYYAYTPRTAAQGGGYDVSHSGAIYLMDPRGRMVGTLMEAQGPDAMADQVRAAIRRAS